MINNIRSTIVLFALFLLLALSHKSFAEIADNKESACPETLSSAVDQLNKKLKDGKWVLIDHSECQNLQSEIIDNANTLVQSNRVLDYLPFMSKKSLRLIRNTYFALKGYKFTDNDLLSHFTKYPWYNPTDENNLQFSAEQIKTTKLIKKIEDSWQTSPCWPAQFCYPAQPMPAGVELMKEDHKTLLKMRKKLLNITPAEIPPSSENSTDSFTTSYAANGIKHWDAVVLCQFTQPGGVDSIWADDISMYSANGKKLSSMGKIINSIDNCPFWIKQRPNILMSYSHRGCCGAISDILVTFDRKLDPIAVIDCPEDACGGTDVFYDAESGDLYFYVIAGPTFFNSKKVDGYAQHIYDSTWGKPGSYINAIWRIEKNGSASRVAELKRTCHNEPIPDERSSWDVVCDKPEGIVLLFPSTDFESCNEIITSVRSKDRLILFKNNGDRSCGSMVIPLSNGVAEK